MLELGGEAHADFEGIRHGDERKVGRDWSRYGVSCVKAFER